MAVKITLLVVAIQPSALDLAQPITVDAEMSLLWLAVPGVRTGLTQRGHGSRAGCIVKGL